MHSNHYSCQWHYCQLFGKQLVSLEVSVSGVCSLRQKDSVVMFFSKINLSTLVFVLFKDRSVSVTTIRVREILTYDVYS